MRSPVWRSRACAFGSLLAALALPAAASAAPRTWAPPRELSDAGSAPLGLAATAGIGPTGDAVVLWHAQDGVESAVRASGHNFGTPDAIRGSKLSMPDVRPGLAFDARGAALAVWAYFEPHPRFVEACYSVDYTFGLRVADRGPNSPFGRAQTLTDNLDADPSADLAIDPSGAAVVVWTDGAGMHAAARPAGKRRFGRAQVIGETPDDPQVTAGSESATAAWAADRQGKWTVSASSAGGSDGFGHATALAIPGLGKARAVIGVDGRSAVTAVWPAVDGRVVAATCRASGRCGRPQPLSAAGEKASEPRVAVAPGGTAVVAWRTPAGISAALRSGHRRFGSPGRLATLAAGQTTPDLAVGIGPRGDAAALWLLHGPDGDRVQAALRHGPTARFAKASDLTAAIPRAGWSGPRVAVDQNGNALAVWGAMIDGYPSIQGTAYDAAR
jgi:hypothetical protein